MSILSETFETLLSKEASRFGVSTADLLSRSRKKEIVAARCAAMQRLRRETTLSLPAIGRLFGRDHSTVLHALRKTTPSRPVSRPVSRTLSDEQVSTIIEARKRGVTLEKIGAEYGLPRSTVGYLCRGILNRRSWKPLPEQLATIIEARKRGNTLKQIAIECGLPPTTIWKPSRDIPKPAHSKNLERNAEIVRLSEAGLLQREIGARYGLTKQAVSVIMRRRQLKGGGQ